MVETTIFLITSIIGAILWIVGMAISIALIRRSRKDVRDRIGWVMMALPVVIVIAVAIGVRQVIIDLAKNTTIEEEIVTTYIVEQAPKMTMQRRLGILTDDIQSPASSTTSIINSESLEQSGQGASPANSEAEVIEKEVVHIDDPRDPYADDQLGPYCYYVFKYDNSGKPVAFCAHAAAEEFSDWSSSYYYEDYMLDDDGIIEHIGSADGSDSEVTYEVHKMITSHVNPLTGEKVSYEEADRLGEEDLKPTTSDEWLVLHVPEEEK